MPADRFTERRIIVRPNDGNFMIRGYVNDVIVGQAPFAINTTEAWGLSDIVYGKS